MSGVASIIADLVSAGVSAELVGRVAAALSEKEPVFIKVADETAERRREKDRERKAEIRRNLRKSSESVDCQSEPYIARADAPVCSNDISNEISKLDTPQSPSGITPTEKSKRAHRLPEDWVLPDDWREAALRKGLSDSEITRQAERILNWSRSSKNGAKLDWRRTWLNWIDDAPRANSRAGPAPERDYGKGALAELIRNVDERLRNEPDGRAEGEISRGNVLSLPVVQGVQARGRDDDGDVSPFAQWLRPGSG